MLHEVFSITAEERGEARFYLCSCGPVMDRLTAEMMELLSLRFTLLPRNARSNIPSHTLVHVPRWDILLYRAVVWKRASTSHRIRQVFRRHRRSYGPPLSEPEYSRLLSQIQVTRAAVLERVALEHSRKGHAPYSDAYLMLTRSEAVRFYEKGGGAQIPGYGTSRRALRGVDEAIALLTDRGINVVAYEPGSHSLVHQITAFFCCKGIFALRGAEFANLIWMRPGSSVVMIAPRQMKIPLLQGLLSTIFGLEYHQISTNSLYPKLDEKLTEEILRFIPSGPKTLEAEKGILQRV